MLNFPLPDLLGPRNPFGPRRYDEAAQKLANVVDDEECRKLSKNLSAGRSLKFHGCSSVSVLKYPLVMSNIAIKNDHRNSGFSH